ncbi:hypothetical protein FOZ62_019917, partial [Perkinsus olseni]
ARGCAGALHPGHRTGADASAVLRGHEREGAGTNRNPHEFTGGHSCIPGDVGLLDAGVVVGSYQLLRMDALSRVRVRLP